MKKVKRAFSTLTCLGAGVDEVIAYAKKWGFSGLEIRLDKQDTVFGLDVGDVLPLKKRIFDAGCVVTDLATAVSVTGKDGAAVTRAMHCADLAAALGARGIRIFAGGTMKTFDDVPVHDLAGAAQTVSEICAYAAQKGVEVWIETHDSLSCAKELCAFCDTVGADNLKVLWDVLHTVEFREEPEESVKIIGDRLAHVHLKDGVRSDDENLTQYRHTALGEGTLPLKRVLSLLDSTGYDGYVSLEWELPWRPELKGCYADTDETMAAFVRWMDAAAQG